MTWHTYSAALREMLKELYTTLDYADVSIITEERKEFKAHKHILSFCSPVFKDILSITKEQCPIIYLRGIQQSEMESILQFIYLGEASFSQDRMNEFLLVANNLQIKEIHKNIDVNVESTYISEPEDERSAENGSTNAKISQDPVPIFKERQPCGKYYEDIKQHVLIKHSNKSKSKFECQHCKHKSSTRANLRTHIQAKHEGAKFPCDQCDYTASSKMGVKHHNDSTHLGIRYYCDKCERTYSLKGDLNRHKEKVHSLDH